MKISINFILFSSPPPSHILISITTAVLCHKYLSPNPFIHTYIPALKQIIPFHYANNQETFQPGLFYSSARLTNLVHKATASSPKCS